MGLAKGLLIPSAAQKAKSTSLWNAYYPDDDSTLHTTTPTTFCLHCNKASLSAANLKLPALTSQSAFALKDTAPDPPQGSEVHLHYLSARHLREGKRFEGLEIIRGNSSF
jgi:hypothetical protein